jgi:hypothetical protein
MEKWRDIVEFPGYQVSDLGRIKNSKGLILKWSLAGRDEFLASLSE